MKFLSGCFNVIMTIVGLIFIAVVVLKLLGYDDGYDEPELVKDGIMGVLVMGNLIAVREEANDLLASYSKADNTEGIKTMRARGEVFVGEKGQKVHVIKYGLLTSYIEIVETGQRGYIDTHSVRSKMYE
ncbi:hypothetical protein LXM56_13540 [Lysinibacillus fusiformis]|uniref:hypothetical protein n=1 Tax=Lysinibacillus fusiformis TaxID=28031 RepID=UPI001E557F69|nr:hypothetical protein [Lysinibacillus fusiformis]MCE4045157.1 hypothetical protein [Lysinibacillus fusiformis]